MTEAVTPDRVASDVQRVFGGPSDTAGRILSVYLYGSLLWGDFDEQTSDVDLIVVVTARPPVIDSYEEVRRFVGSMPADYRLDISTSVSEDIDLPVPCRPYILNAAADHGWLVHGAALLPRGVQLQKGELVDALRFNARQLSRSHSGYRDSCWEEIISRQIKSHFIQLSQLLHSHKPDIPFIGRFERAVGQATSLIPTLEPHEKLFVEAVQCPDRAVRLASMMRTILHLQEVVERDDFPSEVLAGA